MIARRTTLLIMALAALLLSSCVNFDVINVSELNARVLISMPDGSNYTRRVPATGSASSFSTHGGAYTITVLPDEKYRDLLNELRARITQRLWDERSTLTAVDVSQLVQRLNDIDDALDQVAQEGASCSGAAPDFSSVTAVLNYDQGNWQLSCSVATDE